MTLSETRLRELADEGVATLADSTAQEVLQWAVDSGLRLAVAGSMQDTVLVHLASVVLPGVDVLFLDTGYHFAETLQTRDRVAASYRVHLRSITPRQTVPEQDADYGVALHERDPDLCCALRKTQPLDEVLDEYDAWATGLRRVESESRRDTPVVSYDERRDKIKLAPLAAWSDDDVAAYIAHHDLISNPLLAQGYPSIGCGPCTRRVAAGADARSGRWSGTDKVECGIHL
ncbi:phosphoadenosine phosphosulfate reductase [Flexivirga endophytica]|uniref:Adenosine 5'-phosphosulfate reductase n=1 Tax=Flexivirga endophytica TaxID=1849103 RepID=A0A916WWV9_9MICO|nr:phosphoadenylyl-sulfate reductase [Flexivirga endophytica]GGB40266.1 phosphoadenosine phosphosulfate reductase [Flexivirga endophytica]GHB48096.1 phosphoadenosine phosphosulfate reductase [Flexivirga endophytica]